MKMGEGRHPDPRRWYRLRWECHERDGRHCRSDLPPNVVLLADVLVEVVAAIQVRVQQQRRAA
ncbi:MAG TPA: hypothetical protein VKD72_15060 [Gemmataceae bacterium]|nr:hypothetical protein [Gemmataceae bacterium]